ncbi:MAG: methyl-accepting chemotaxis protein [Treponema sp.]|jgi:methyl-accepting chemotaxis protein|nr:methyl-accepting chemotaxis protein [Treponema sp.]
MAAQTSIKRKFIIFSVIMFSVIFILGSVGFSFSMWRNVQTNTGREMVREIQAERIRLESLVNAEIAIALKMADSPIIINYFVNPSDPALEKIAFEEIAGYRRAFKSKSLFWVNDIDHRFYSNDAYSYTIDVNDPNNYWYLMTLKETDKYNFNINYNPNLKVTNLWINVPVFDNRRNPVGILGTGMDLTSFIDSVYNNYDGKAELYFFNALGEITGSKDKSLVENKKTVDKAFGKTGEYILDRVKTLKSGEVQSFSVAGSVAAISDVSTLGWYVITITPIGFLDVLNNTMTFLFLAMMAVIAVIITIFILLITGLLKPMNIMITTLNQISTDWDLTRRLDIKHKDETSTLAEFTNLFFEKISELIQGIKKKAFTLLDTGEELNNTMNDTSQAIWKIDEHIEGMREMVLGQADEVDSAASSMERIIGGLDDLSSHIAVQAESVSQSSSAIEQMLASISSVTDTLVKNTANINSLAESSEAGRTDLKKVAQDIQEIAQESEGLLEINSVMQNISSQTNLLAMNAAIEAAHAGETGKGFAVVADEIRKLAENSGKQSKTISAVLKKIKGSIDAITKSTGVVLERFGTIEKEVETVSDQETQIRNAMEKQETGSRNILEAVNRLNVATGEVQKSSQDMALTSKEVHDQSSKLKGISHKVADGVDDIMKSMMQILNAVTRVKEICQENKENIDSLNTDVARFKVD